MSVEEQLRTDFDKAAQEMPLAPLSWDQTLSRARRGRMIRIASVTAAAAVLAATAVVGAGTLTKTGPPPIAPASPAESAIEVPSGARATVQRYVEALGAGDARAAWRLMSPKARRAVGGYDRFEMLVSDTLQDGLGSFAGAQDVRYLASMAFPPSQDLEPDYLGRSGAVTVLGTVASEGTPQLRLAVVAFEYDRDLGRVLVHQSFDGRSTVFLSGSSADGELARGRIFEARMIASSGTNDVSFHIDGDEFDFGPVEARQLTDEVRLRARLPRSLTPGRHVLTMILIDKDTGRIYGSATEIEVITP